ncbi:MAG: response regulator transcription factor [bacterium]|nr:response regulator transcription factor [bacterium]
MTLGILSKYLKEKGDSIQRTGCGETAIKAVSNQVLLKAQPFLCDENNPAIKKLIARCNVSRREQDVLLLLLQGKSNREIEEELFISISTVKNHVYSLFRKIKVKKRYQVFNLVLKMQRQMLNAD